MMWRSMLDVMLVMALLFVVLWVFVRALLFILDLRDNAVVELEREQRSQTSDPDRKLTAA